MNPRLTKQLIKARQDLKKKYKSLKSDITKSQTHLEKTYQPITDPLKQLVSVLGKQEIIKQENLTPKSEKFSFLRKPPRKDYTKIAYSSFPSPLSQTIKHAPEHESTRLNESEIYENQPDQTFEYQPRTSDEQVDEYIEDTIKSLHDLTTNPPPSFVEYLDQFTAPLPRDYILRNISDIENKFDHVLGIYHDIETEKFRIGDSELNFDGSDIVIKGIKYPGTPGLYELLFLKEPIAYKQTDVNEYVDIIKRTNAARRNNDPDLPIKNFSRDIKDKYNFIIKPKLETGPFRRRVSSIPSSLMSGIMTRSKKIGKGMLQYSNKPIDYKYFDNYNELIDRLRLLVASQTAGNTGNNNEIVSIIEELREGGIIM
ncbi:unnamed protein product [Psylliodes chrysocephalus]|uniref:DUF8207 domain-containing protein n=1 Tax=Psylliodes chrysocephalus TaxID=3402493 RepID=A0A9P0G687_9CUCU|nr:unnamed protein product [Psylliodes chrysocephala]